MVYIRQLISRRASYSQPKDVVIVTRYAPGASMPRYSYGAAVEKRAVATAPSSRRVSLRTASPSGSAKVITSVPSLMIVPDTLHSVSTMLRGRGLVLVISNGLPSSAATALTAPVRSIMSRIMSFSVGFMLFYFIIRGQIYGIKMCNASVRGKKESIIWLVCC